MNEKQLTTLISLTKRLHRQKYPFFIIILLVIASLLGSGEWLQGLFLTSPANECEVIKVYDGDTVTLQCPGRTGPTKVRMYCIDTPEIKQQPWGIQARDHLRAIIGRTVQVKEINKDRYGRTVGEIYSGNVNLNLAQVKAGKAAVYHTYCKKSEYKLAEKQAQTAKAGIWSQPGLQQTPWQWRKRPKT
jgi:endonuclease YncB( thermonuclease family)